MKLRGFKGIRSGLNRDFLELDLSDHGGLVAIVGPNGSGKTTILDNLHPFRIMPYRAGSYSPRAFSYYNECYGCDALKELVFEMDGQRFKSLVLIDTDRKRQEAHLYRWSGKDWKALCGGRMEEYDKAIEDLLGSPRLFFLSVFRCQDSTKLSDYTKGEAKDIFVELLGIEDLKEKSRRAREYRDGMLREMEVLRMEKDRLSSLISSASDTEERMKEIRREISSIESEIEGIEKEMESGRNTLQRLKEDMAVMEERLKERKALEEKASVIRDRIRQYVSLVEKSGEIKESAGEEKRYQCRLELLRREYDGVEREISGLQSELTSLREEEKDLVRLRKELSELGLKRTHRTEVLKDELRRARETSALLDRVPCDDDLKGRCPILENAITSRDSIPGIIQGLESMKDMTAEEKALEEEIRGIEPRVMLLRDMERRFSEKIKERQSISEKMKEVEQRIRMARESSSLLPRIELAEKELPSLKKELEDIEKKLSFIDDGEEKGLSEKVRYLAGRIVALESRRKELLGRLSELKRTLGSMEAVVEQSRTSVKELKRIEKSMKEKEKDISEWSLLERALGSDGIIALEIDDAGPAISAIANELLSCFGSRFTVRIDTQVARAGGKGLRETFDIMVFDSTRNESKSLRIMSGGEKVWIEEAIARAISLYNSQRSGRKYRALFTDEKDGALDFQRKREFVSMKRKVLEVGGYDVEFFISQSPEVQEIADYRIELSG